MPAFNPSKADVDEAIQAFDRIQDRVKVRLSPVPLCPSFDSELRSHTEYIAKRCKDAGQSRCIIGADGAVRWE